MTTRTVPPFRADHVGSVLRPPELTGAREEHSAGRIGAAELRAAEDEAIRDAVALQRRVGLQSVTDGEFRRGSWHMDFIYQLGGVERAEGAFTFHYRGGRAAVDEVAYPDMEAFWSDVSAAYGAQVAAIAEIGCTYLQLDDTSLAYLNEIAKHELVVETAAEVWG